MSSKKRALGKGLSALLENSETDITSNYERGSGREAPVAGSIAMISISSVETNPFQPRTKFEKEALIDLTESVKQHGIIQPITVRKVGNDTFQIISGERRFRASQLAGLKEVPAYVRVANDQTMLEMALVENIQREDLDAVEVALSFQRLLDECDLTQEQLSEKVAKKRSTVTNYLRLLKLPAEVQLAIRDKEISMGHARALLGVEDESKQKKILKKILKEKLSVRQVEDLIRGLGEKPATKKKTASKSEALSFEEQKFKDDLQDTIGTKVDIKKGNNGEGKLVINFASDSDLKRIIDILDI